MTTRRDLLKGAAAVATVSAIPSLPAVAVSLSPAAPASEPLVAFMVGTPGEHDGAHIWARNLKEAFQIWGEQQGTMCGSDECERCFDRGEPERPCTCDPTYYAKRYPKWDNLDHEATPADWLKAGCGYMCDRCGNEEGFEDGYVIDGDAVCVDCMTLADWKTEDPEYYAEQIDELLTEEYGEAVTQ